MAEKERNSELKLSAVLSMVIIALGGAATALLDSGSLESWPWAVAIATGVAGLSALGVNYTTGRAAKKLVQEKAKAMAATTDDPSQG